MENETKTNSLLPAFLKASLVAGLFATVLVVSISAIGSYVSNSDLKADAQFGGAPAGGAKQFDFGAANGPGIPTGMSAPHFVSHALYSSVHMGTAVDTESGPNDVGGFGDQDGLNVSESHSGGISVNVWHTVGDGSTYFPGAVPLFPSVNDVPRNRLGTVIVGYWKKAGASFTFETLGSTPVRWTHRPIYVPFSHTLTGDQEGWLTVIYTQLDLTTACGGVFNGCTTGFTQANLGNWNGSHESLMNILYGFSLSNPVDVSIPPGEVSDFKACTKGGVTAFFNPDDAGFATMCGSDLGSPTPGQPGQPDEPSDEPSTGIAGIYQPPCSPLVFFEVNITHPLNRMTNLKVQHSLDGGGTFEKSLIDSATGINGDPSIDNDAEDEIQIIGVRTDVSPETVSVAIDTTETVSGTNDQFKLRVVASEGRVKSTPLDTQVFTVSSPDASCHGAAPTDGDNGGNDNVGDPTLNPPLPPSPTFPNDPILNPPPTRPVVAPPLPPITGGIGGGRVTRDDLQSFYNFLGNNGINPNDFTTSIGRELATRIAIHIMLMNDKLTENDIATANRPFYPDSDVSKRPGKEISLATVKNIVQGLPDGKFYPYRNPTVVEAYQIIVELGRYMSPKIAQVLAEEKVFAQNSPDWFEPYIQTMRRFNLEPYRRNYFELGELITTMKFVELLQDLFSQAELSDPFTRQPDLAQGIFWNQSAPQGTTTSTSTTVPTRSAAPTNDTGTMPQTR